MHDKELKEELLEMEKLTLENVKEKIIAAETTRKEIKLMESDNKEGKRIEPVRRIRNKKPNTVSDQCKTLAVEKRNCLNCGNKHGPRSCPAYGKECYKCHKTVSRVVLKLTDFQGTVGWIRTETPLKESKALLQTLNGGKLLNMGKALVEFGVKNANIKSMFREEFHISL